MRRRLSWAIRDREGVVLVEGEVEVEVEEEGADDSVLIEERKI